ncbi:MAG: uroporphyrinogen decarboxylase family protein [Promethearchaeota archaeon]
MNCSERYLAVYDDKERKKLDRVPTHVQYIREEFIDMNKEIIFEDYCGEILKSLYFDIPHILGFDSIFAPFPSSYKFKTIKTKNKEGGSIRIREDGQSIRSNTSYYEGGYIKNLNTFNEIKANLKLIENHDLINKVITRYEELSPKIFPVLMVDGIFDKVWKSMGMIDFSYHFRKRTVLYRELIEFYAHLTEINITGLINATGNRGKVVTLLDDVAYKGYPMISPERWEGDFMPYYKSINSIISDANLISQIHTDGDATELISSFKKAGFRGLQGFEGGCDPFNINERYPDFVLIGFGDVSYTLPYGTSDQIEFHVKNLMDVLKENRHFIIGPSTVIFKEIPLKNVRTFMTAAKNYGKYN